MSGSGVPKPPPSVELVTRFKAQSGADCGTHRVRLALTAPQRQIFHEYYSVTSPSLGRMIGRIPMRTSKAPTTRKAKKSYTLSVESVAFLEATRKRRHAASVSSVLEEILQYVRRREHRATIESAVTGYYSSLSSEETSEHKAWGDLALREFPRSR